MSYATKEQLAELAAYMASQINVPTIGIGGGYAPIGTIISYMGTTAPQDYLACNGSTKNIADYPQLADFFETQFGSKNYFGGDGVTTFAVPDLQGEFLRGTGTNSHTNQGSGANVGVHQDGTELTNPWLFNNKVYFPGKNETEIKADKFDSDFGAVAGRAVFNSAQQDTDTTRNKFITSRPTNTSVLYCIKAVNAGEVYSTNERVVGTWIDGKPLYQKTWSIASPTEGIKLAENVDYCHVVSKNYSRKYSSGDTIDGDDFWYTANDYVNIRVVKNPNSSDMNLSICYKASNNSFTLENLYLTVQYTKTTD